MNAKQIVMMVKYLGIFIIVASVVRVIFKILTGSYFFDMTTILGVLVGVVIFGISQMLANYFERKPTDVPQYASNSGWQITSSPPWLMMFTFRSLPGMGHHQVRYDPPGMFDYGEWRWMSEAFMKFDHESDELILYRSHYKRHERSDSNGYNSNRDTSPEEPIVYLFQAVRYLTKLAFRAGRSYKHTKRARAVETAKTYSYGVVGVKLTQPLDEIIFYPESITDKFTQSIGFTDVDTESYDFNRYWRVETNEPLKYAHSLLTPTVIHALTTPDRSVLGAVAIMNGYILSAVEWQEHKAGTLERRIEILKDIARSIPPYLYTEHSDGRQRLETSYSQPYQPGIPTAFPQSRPTPAEETNPHDLPYSEIARQKKEGWSSETDRYARPYTGQKTVDAGEPASEHDLPYSEIRRRMNSQNGVTQPDKDTVIEPPRRGLPPRPQPFNPGSSDR